MKNGRKLERRLLRNIRLLAAHEFFSCFQFISSIAVLLFETMTGSFASAMSVFSVLYVSIALFEIPTGILSDKIGRRYTLILGACTEFTGILIYIAAIHSAHPLYLLYLGSVFRGLAESLFSGNNHAMTYETLAYYRKKKEISTALGRIASTGQAALAIAGLVSMAVLWAGYSYTHLLYMTSVSLFISIIVAAMTVEPPARLVNEGTALAHLKKAVKLLAKNQKLRLLTIATTIQNGGGYANYFIQPGFIDSVWPHWLTPFYRTVQNGIGVFSFWFAGRVIKRFDAIRIIFAGNILSNVIGLSAYWIANAFSPIMTVLTQIAYGFGTTAERTIQQRNFTDSQRATMGSLVSFGGSLLTAVICVVMGWLADTINIALSMFIALAVRAVIINYLYYRLYKNHDE